MTPQEASTIFFQAAKEIKERGQCKARFNDSEGRICMIQAISLAAGEGMLKNVGPFTGCGDKTSQLQNFVRRIFSSGICDLNNYRCKTVDDAVAFFNELGKKALEAESI